MPASTSFPYSKHLRCLRTKIFWEITALCFQHNTSLFVSGEILEPEKSMSKTGDSIHEIENKLQTNDISGKVGRMLNTMNAYGLPRLLIG